MSFVEAIRRWLGRKPRPEDDRHWQLFIGDELLGDLRYAGYEFPWVTCRFERTAAFARFERYFAYFERSDDSDVEEEPELERLLIDVRRAGGYRLVGLPSGEPTSSPLIHFDGDYATFR